jgi:hypothetical protein
VNSLIIEDKESKYLKSIVAAQRILAVSRAVDFAVIDGLVVYHSFVLIMTNFYPF